MGDFTPKKLAQALVEKHDRLISEYSDEIEKTQQIAMLKEKKDQLLHWVDENGGKSKYYKELEETQKELSHLKETFKPKSQSYYAGVKERITEHKAARDYWLQRVGELKS
ncbi:MAG: hypothetical protein V1744_06145 [Candidatus Altiarchaeota archaeon]